MSDTRVKIAVDLPTGQVSVCDPETGKPILSVEGMVLTIMPGRTEAALIVDEPIIQGDWVIPVKEQMVISDAFTELLIARVKSRITRQIEDMTDWYNRLATAHEQTAKDLDPSAVDMIARRVIEVLDARTKTQITRRGHAHDLDI